MKHLITFMLLLFLTVIFLIKNAESPVTDETVVALHQEQLIALENYIYHPEMVLDTQFRNRVHELYDMVTGYEEYVHPQIKTLINNLLVGYGMVLSLHFFLLILIIKFLIGFLFYKKDSK